MPVAGAGGCGACVLVLILVFRLTVSLVLVGVGGPGTDFVVDAGLAFVAGFAEGERRREFFAQRAMRDGPDGFVVPAIPAVDHLEGELLDPDELRGALGVDAGIDDGV